ncbi:MAG TPA: hypothetical protein VHX11_05505 [Acidobacteriaceae bacterium]|nr:hypothetical protein [Acidobacteriaceae bacterium]
MRRVLCRGHDEGDSMTLRDETEKGGEPASGSSAEPTVQTPEEELDERRRLRRLQIMMDMVTSVICQDASLTVDEAAEMVADCKKAALAMFPDKELAYNLIYKPRLQRIMRERFRIQ